MQSASRSKTRDMVIIGVLSAIAFVVVTFGRVPLVLFLKYDPKDIVIAIGGLIFGPIHALLVSVIVSLVEMVTISDTGVIGMIFNVLGSASFACTAALIYRRRHSAAGAVVGLVVALFTMTAVMLLWNYLITPIYLGVPREKVAEMLLPTLLPFNLIKGGINAAITLLLYKPIVTAMRRAKLAPSAAPSAQVDAAQVDVAAQSVKPHLNIGVAAVAIVILATSILLLLVVRGVI